jgi:hypothetical protein
MSCFVVGKFSEIGFMVMKKRALKEIFGREREKLSGN